MADLSHAEAFVVLQQLQIHINAAQELAAVVRSATAKDSLLMAVPSLHQAHLRIGAVTLHMNLNDAQKQIGQILGLIAAMTHAEKQLVS